MLVLLAHIIKRSLQFERQRLRSSEDHLVNLGLRHACHVFSSVNTSEQCTVGLSSRDVFNLILRRCHIP